MMMFLGGLRNETALWFPIFVIFVGLACYMALSDPEMDSEPNIITDSGEMFIVQNCGNHTDLYHRVIIEDSIARYVGYYPCLIDFKSDGLILWGKVVVNKKLHPRYCDCTEFHILTNELRTLDKYIGKYHLPGDAIKRTCAPIWEEI